MLKLRLLSYCIALCLCVVFKPQQVFAETLYEDNFDDNILDNWKVVRNFSWYDFSQPCREGDHLAAWQILLQRLGIRIDGPGCVIEIVPTDFSLPPEQGYTFEFDMTMPTSTNMDRNYILKFLDPDHSYSVKVLDTNIFVEKTVIYGSPMPNSGGTYPFEADHTYHIRNEFRADNSLKIFVNDTLVINTIDEPPFVSGGTIGFRASVGSIPTSEVWFDNAKVTTLSDPRDTSLDVPYWSQRNPLWATENYDSADNWAKEEKTSIERWGCALTSAVMALQYHNITNITPNLPITPLTLNAWLKSQPDGYVGDGLVNWVAITRLTKQFNLSHPSVPALEYAFADLAPSQARHQIEQEQPFIVELPKHFVLARGIAYDNHSLKINDPFDQNRISLPISEDIPISARVFTTSFTDLSYIMAVQSVEVDSEIRDTSNTLIASHQESIEDDLSPGNTSPSIIYQLAKPPDGKYRLQINSSSAPTYQLDLYFYNTKGEVQHETVTGNSYSLPAMYEIEYNKESITTIKKLHADFLEELQSSYVNHGISSASAYYTLLKMGKYRESALNDEDNQRYTNYIRTLLNDFSTVLAEGTKQRLEETL